MTSTPALERTIAPAMDGLPSDLAADLAGFLASLGDEGDALAEALGQSDGRSDSPPQGPPLTAGETEALIVAVKECWNIGALSTDEVIGALVEDEEDEEDDDAQEEPPLTEDDVIGALVDDSVAEEVETDEEAGTMTILQKSSGEEITLNFEDIAEELPEGRAVALRVMREGVTRYIAYTPSSD